MFLCLGYGQTVEEYMEALYCTNREAAQSIPGVNGVLKSSNFFRTSVASGVDSAEQSHSQPSAFASSRSIHTISFPCSQM
jgi:hypothetical protein